MDEMQAVERARGFRDAGRRAEALQLLKEHLADEPARMDARMALVGLYRELGAPDQAGRWGIAVPGCTTPRERDRLARLLAAAGVAPTDMPGFLGLPSRDLPAEVVDLLPAVDAYREAFGSALLDRQRAESAEDPLEEVQTGLALIAALLFAVGLVGIWAGTLLGASMVAFGRWASVASLVVIVPALVVRAVRRGRAGRRLASAGWAAAAVLLGLGVVRLVALGIDGGGTILFSWER